MKRVFIIHGWGGSSNQDWLLWLKNKLEEEGFKVFVPDMPETNIPKIKEWLSSLSEIVGVPDEDTYFVGHSIGCQAIMRYLEGLDEKIKIGGAVFVAGWFNLTDDTWDEEIYTKETADQWINTPIDFNKIKMHSNKFVDIASENDPYVSLNDSQIFKKNLNAKIIILKNKGHVSGEDGVIELPEALDELLKIAK